LLLPQGYLVEGLARIAPATQRFESARRVPIA
jgi:hypothetical protein